VSEIKITEAVTLDTRRCYDCGRWWASEPGIPGDCPICTRRDKDKRWEEYEAQARTIIALRGALTKAKRQGPRR
jgi:hypothetical protein